MKTANIELDAKLKLGMTYQLRVMNKDGSPASEWTKPIRNLILPAGATGGTNFHSKMSCVHVGTGTTPNKVDLNGTFSQTGTTVTRASGTGEFVSANVNDFIKFGTGETAKITAFTNSVTVTVDRTQTVAASSLAVYDTSRIQLDNWIKSSFNVGATGTQTNDSDLGTTTYVRTIDQTVETTARNYTEIGVNSTSDSSAQLFSRIVLDSPISVAIDQFLQTKVTFVLKVGAFRTLTEVEPTITGWPYPYTITDITSNGTYWDVTVSEAHHYATGREITISDALPATVAISSISSNPSEFTVTTGTAHNKSPGDSIVIAGASPGSYNGTWTVVTTPTSTTLVVTSAINPGAGSGGTLRLSTPGTWYNGTHTIASFPNSTTIRITNANTITQAGSGTVTNSLVADCIITDIAFASQGNTGNKAPLDITTPNNMYVRDEAGMRTGLAYGTNASQSSGALANISVGTNSYNTANRKISMEYVIPSGFANSTTLRQFWFNSGIALTFRERQRKNVGYQLKMSMSYTWEPDLI